MIILRSSCVVLFLLFSCKEKAKSDPNTSKDLKIVFTDTLSESKLNNFKFGICSDNEELPLELILDRKNSLVNKKNNIVLIHNIKNVKQNFYGYFSKKGYRTKKFIIDKNSNYQNVMIVPEPTNISIKAFDKEVSNEIDSISVSFEIKENNISTKEYFKFNKTNLTPYLEYFNKNIYLGQSIDVKIKVYKSTEVYKLEKHFEYDPLLHSSIILI